MQRADYYIRHATTLPSMRVLIIEDEAPAARRMAQLVLQLRPNAELLGPCDTVRAAVEVLANLQVDAVKAEPAPDLILCDIELADGLSFQIWEQCRVDSPVIFTTAYDQYALRAFRVNSIDYLLKPIKLHELEVALERYEAQRQPQLPPQLIDQLLRATTMQQPAYRKRVLAAHGTELVPLATAELVHFFSEERLSFAVDRAGRTHVISEPLSRLCEELDPQVWFQINRAELVNIESVQKASPHLNHRLKLSLKPAGRGDHIVARERVAAFRAWLGGG